LNAWRAGFALASALAMSACVSVGPLPNRTAPEPTPPTTTWYSPIGRHHALAGQIWNVHDARFVHRADLVAALVKAKVVLLGEQHDNVDHHRLQAALLRAMTDAGRRPIVLFEMIDADDQSKLDAALAAPRADDARASDAIPRAVGWSERGWPVWEAYARIADVAIERDLPIVAANLPRREARAIAKTGAGAIDAAEAKRLGIDETWPEALEASLEEELVLAHCGHLRGAAIARMALAQRARDAQMAERMLMGRGDGAVLIAGAGHVRTDRGVPYVLAKRGAASIASVALVEVEEGRVKPAEYASQFHAASLPFDFVVFTPRTSDADPCTAFR
jgi:uncharacterized iron-regulated protein